MILNIGGMPITLSAAEEVAAEERGGTDLKFLFGRETVARLVQLKFFHIGICSVQKFASFAENVDDLKKVLKDEFELDASRSLAERTEVANMVCCFTTAQARSQKMAEVEAEMDTRSWVKPVPKTEYAAMRAAFETKYWALDDKEMPSKDYIEKLLEKIESGEFHAEMLSEVVSKDEVEPESLMPVWDRTGNMTIKRSGTTVPLPTSPEALRRRITILGYAHIMVAMKHTNQTALAGLDPGFFDKYKSYLLGDFVLNLTAKNDRGEVIISPPWHLILAYEQAIRKKACYDVNNGTMASFRDALQAAWKDPVTKERHFVTPLALTSAPSVQKRESDSGGLNNPKRWKGGQKGGGKNTQSKGGGGKSSSSKGQARTPEGKAICFRYNDPKKKCTSKPCRFEHVCAFCFQRHPRYQCTGKGNQAYSAPRDTSGSGQGAS